MRKPDAGDHQRHHGGERVQLQGAGREATRPGSRKKNLHEGPAVRRREASDSTHRRATTKAAPTTAGAMKATSFRYAGASWCEAESPWTMFRGRRGPRRDHAPHAHRPMAAPPPSTGRAAPQTGRSRRSARPRAAGAPGPATGSRGCRSPFEDLELRNVDRFLQPVQRNQKCEPHRRLGGRPRSSP